MIQSRLLFQNIILHVIVFVALSFLLSSCDKNRTSCVNLSNLDQTIRNKEVFIATKQRNIDSLKIELMTSSTNVKKFETCNILFDSYFDFQNDSAMVYSNRMRRYAEQLHRVNREYLIVANLKRVKLLRFTGQLKEATELLASIDRKTLSKELTNHYFIEAAVNYSFLASNSTESEYKGYYNIMAQVYRDSLLMDSTANLPNIEIVKAERLLSQDKAQEALELLSQKYSTLSPLTKKAGTIAFNIALCYQSLGNDPKYIDYLILSSITDLNNAVRGYRSLYNLAVALFEMGYIESSYKYMKCCMDDAISSNAKIRAHEASEMFLIIDKSYQILKKEQDRKTSLYFVLLCIISGIMLVSLVVVICQNQRLVDTRRRLLDANLTKDGYLGIFIEEYSRHLFRINNYRVKACKVMMSGDIGEIERFVDKALNISDDMKELHRKFDATILQLFPTFIDEYNALLKDGIAVKPTDNELTAEQRIAALIRLGIKESDKIALFLRYSTRTVYNYRSQMRAKSKIGSESFEDKIMTIGLSKDRI